MQKMPNIHKKICPRPLIINNPKKHFCFGCFPGDMAMWLYGLWSKNGIEWSGWIPLMRCTVWCNMCGANNDLLLSFWDLCNVFWLQLRQEQDSSWDLGTPSRWHHDNLRTSCHVDTCLLALSQAHLLDKELTKISKKLLSLAVPNSSPNGSCLDDFFGYIWGPFFSHHFRTLFDDPCSKRHPALTTTIALINFWQMIYVQLLFSGTTQPFG